MAPSLGVLVGRSWPSLSALSQAVETASCYWRLSLTHSALDAPLPVHPVGHSRGRTCTGPLPLKKGP